MPVTKKDIDLTTDRSLYGEKFNIAGHGVYFTNAIPADVEVAFDAQDGPRVPVWAVRNWNVPGGFKAIWLFHAAQPGVTLRMIAYTDDVLPSFAGTEMRVVGGRGSAATVSAQLDGEGAPGFLMAGSVGMVKVGTPGASVETVRGLKNFLSIFVTAAGDTALWAPVAGTRFRLMRYRYTLLGNSTMAAAGTLSLQLKDGATVAFIERMYVPAAAANVLGGYQSPWMDLGNGWLSSALAQTLFANLSSALVTGGIQIQLAGMLETA